MNVNLYLAISLEDHCLEKETKIRFLSKGLPADTVHYIYDLFVEQETISDIVVLRAQKTE